MVKIIFGMNPIQRHKIAGKLLELNAKFETDIAYLEELDGYFFMIEEKEGYKLTSADSPDFKIDKYINFTEINNYLTTVTPALLPLFAYLTGDKPDFNINLSPNESGENLNLNLNKGGHNPNSTYDEGGLDQNVTIYDGESDVSIEHTKGLFKDMPKLGNSKYIGNKGYSLPSLVHIINETHVKKERDLIIRINKELDRKLKTNKKNNNINETAKKRYYEVVDIIDSDNAELYNDLYNKYSEIIKNAKQSTANTKTYNEKKEQEEGRFFKNVKIVLSTLPIVAAVLIVIYFGFISDFNKKTKAKKEIAQTEQTTTPTPVKENKTKKQQKKRKKQKAKKKIYTAQTIDNLVDIYTAKYKTKKFFRYSKDKIIAQIGSKPTTAQRVRQIIINYIKKVK